MRKITEYEIQKSFVQEISLYPKIRQYLFAIPNGGSRHMLEAIKLKASGVTPGIPDLFLSLPSRKYHGLYLECKRDGGRVTPEQRTKMDLFQAKGYECQVFKSREEGRLFLGEYLELEKLIEFKD